MTLDFTKKGKVKIRMADYVKRMLKEFPIKFDESQVSVTPAANNRLDTGKGEILHTKNLKFFIVLSQKDYL